MKYTAEQHAIIGKKVATYRTHKDRNLTQDQLGKLCGKSLGWINKFEKGNTAMRCDDETLQLLANALQIPVGWLAPDSEIHTDLPEYTRQNRTSIDIPYKAECVDELKEQLLALTDEQLTILKFALLSLGR